MTDLPPHLAFLIRERRMACEAFDRMVASRPLEPPTRTPPPVPQATAAELALVADRRAGLL